MAAKQYVTAEQMRALVRGYSGVNEPCLLSFAAYPEILEKYGFTTKLRLTALIATAMAETGGCTIRDMRENMNYSAGRIMQVWPSRPMAVRFVGNPRGLANAVYNGRMGNRSGTDDGWNYRGGGLNQCTGRDNYSRAERLTGLPLLEQPDLIAQPKVALEVACAECAQFMKYADMGADGWRAFSNGINRGNALSAQNPIGWADRQTWYRKTAKVLGDSAQRAVRRSERSRSPEPVATVGHHGDDIQRAQEALQRLGYAMVGRVDGFMGPRTEAAIFAFQSANELAATGKLDAPTMAHLESSDARRMPLGDRAHEGADDLHRAGDVTIQNGRAVSAAGKTIVGIGTLEMLDQTTGVVGQVDNWLNHFELYRSVTDRLGSFASWGMENWHWVIISALLLGGLSLVYHARGIISARVAAHREGRI